MRRADNTQFVDIAAPTSRSDWVIGWKINMCRKIKQN